MFLTVAILAQGTSRAVAVTQAFFQVRGSADGCEAGVGVRSTCSAVARSRVVKVRALK